eukprot:5098072-Pyramimonas_sp.AAC.1
MMTPWMVKSSSLLTITRPHPTRRKRGSLESGPPETGCETEPGPAASSSTPLRKSPLPSHASAAQGGVTSVQLRGTSPRSQNA